MSSPIASSGLYVPIHRRTPSSAGSSPSLSTRALSPSPLPHTPGVYTPAELLALSHSPLIATLSVPHVNALRAIAPEVVQTRKQRKALAWQARHPTHASSGHGHRRTSSRGSSSGSDEDGMVSWRRT